MMIVPNYAERDQEGKVSFYVLLWKRNGITSELFEEYWHNVHGPVCARLPGQHQYWQFRVTRNEGGIFPSLNGLVQSSPADEQFGAIAELTFKSEEDRQTWFQAAAILMDDEHNIFSQAIGYNTSPGNSITYVDKLENGSPNGDTGTEKFHVMIRQAKGISLEAFRQYMRHTFVTEMAESDQVLKLRLHLFEEVDNTRPEAAGVSHSELPEKQYQAAIELAFKHRLALETFLDSNAFAKATQDLSKYIKDLRVFPEKTTHTYVYDGQLTLAGQRGATVAGLIEQIGAVNQLQENITALMFSKT